ncbi:putative bifunctional diguanylate cyclase/phosphodiesterase [Noviherbaspirillum malthae]|uniref:putative bifunctional diguanylate cyclase/phosphodiesterase n=1 Tax=Noviherbaspirillum malthae TaxID=1260987 RepID=UPI001890B055|nr:EAL domain-containing protein [Noviherbaspirillum malthae]
MLSIAIAVFASFVAFNLTGRVAAARSRRAAACWLAGSALSMGTGIWAMHFIGMLALKLAIPVFYDLGPTVLSLLIAIGVSAYSLHILNLPSGRKPQLLVAGAVMAGGIVAMHYVGMSALALNPAVTYDSWLVFTSILIAAAASTGALSINRRVRGARAASGLPLRLLGALVMGLSIAGMHYTGMAAAHIPAGAVCITENGVLNAWWLAWAVGGIAFLLLATSFHLSVVDSYLAARSGQHTLELEKVNNDLERKAAELMHANSQLRQEIQERIRSEEKVAYLAYHDTLTSLPNRRMLSSHLLRAMNQAQRHGRMLALLLIDLDRFKTVNDTMGHEAGDQLLQEVATRIRHCLRESDIIARLGGDEFVVLLEDVDAPATVAVVAEKILAVARWPFVIGEQEFYVTASIGVSLFPRDGHNEQSLLRCADVAMYKAKDDGKNAFRFYCNELNEHVIEKLTLETYLRTAIERREISMHYQPKVGLPGGRIVGVEALMRWTHPKLGTVPPTRFIPLAEETRLIHQLGRWAIEESCRQAVAWREQGFGDLNVAVNLSVSQFSDEGLHRDIAAILIETGMDPTRLELEITESMFMDRFEESLKTIVRLKEAGVRIAVDDFGTGFSSLSTLKNLPIDTLKIDGAFVRGLPSDTKDAGITRAIVAMAKTLNVTVVAEAVETEAQRDFLQAASCDQVQGYYYSKPVPAAQLSAMLAAAPAPVPASLA